MNDAIDENLCIPAELIPRCPKCGAEMEPWVRGYTFLEGKKYKEEYRKINEFLTANQNKKILFLELNCTPFVRQYDILNNKWGALLCQKESQTKDIHQNSRKWL